MRPFGKTKGSLTKVPIAEVMANEIAEYREECKREGKDTSPDAFMFPGRSGGPMDSSNYRNRVLQRLARELGLPKLNFPVIRRTIATLGKNMGHPKNIQGLMRHTRLATTMEVYMQSLEPEVRKAINSIHGELVATGTRGSTRKTPAVTALSSSREPVFYRPERQRFINHGQQSRSGKREGGRGRPAARQDFAICGQKCGQTIWEDELSA